MVKEKKKPELKPLVFSTKFPKELVVDVYSMGFTATTPDDLDDLDLDTPTEVGIYKLVGVGIFHPQAHLERK